MVKRVLITSVREYQECDYFFYPAYQVFERIGNIAREFGVDVDVIKCEDQCIKLCLKGTKDKIQATKNIFIAQYGKHFRWKDVWL